MGAQRSISLIIPFHKDYFRLESTLQRIASSYQNYNVKEILLCHNGPDLEKTEWEQVRSWMAPPMKLLHVDEKGLGAAYKLGIRNASQDYILLSHSDFPFGWSDLEEFHKLLHPPTLVLGSKAHPYSKAMSRPKKRLMATQIFKFLRKLILGWHTPGDSQGTVIIENKLAKVLEPHCHFNNYLFSAEITSLFQYMGGKPLEVPVILEEEMTPSNVRVVKDGVLMFAGLFRIASVSRVIAPRVSQELLESERHHQKASG